MLRPTSVGAKAVFHVATTMDQLYTDAHSNFTHTGDWALPVRRTPYRRMEMGPFSARTKINTLDKNGLPRRALAWPGKGNFLKKWYLQWPNALGAMAREPIP